VRAHRRICDCALRSQFDGSPRCQTRWLLSSADNLPDSAVRAQRSDLMQSPWKRVAVGGSPRVAFGSQSPESGEVGSPSSQAKLCRCVCVSVGSRAVDSKWGGCGCRRPPPEGSAAVGVARRPRHAWNQVWLRQGLLRSAHSPDRRAKHQVVSDYGLASRCTSIVTVEGVSFHQFPMTRSTSRAARG